MKDNHDIYRISERISDLFGFSYSEKQYDSLERNLLKVSAELRKGDTLKEIRAWLEQPDLTEWEMEVLSRHLTIGETYFFREKGGLSLFQNVILPSGETTTKDPKRRLNLWSAGCSSGEEPYTLAILLRETLPDIEQWDINLLATDVNPTALRKAQEGVYTPWSFRETSEEIKQKYFTPRGKLFEISPIIRNMVTFRTLNLATDHYPSNQNHTAEMDVIFCRNVLMYFSPPMIRSIASKLYQSLKPDGWLITSQVELNDDYFAEYQRVMYAQGVFYQKRPPSSNPPGSISPGKPEITGESSQVRKRTRNNKQKVITKPSPPLRGKSDNTRTTHRSSPKKGSPEIRAIELFHNKQYSDCIDFCQPYAGTVHSTMELEWILVRALANTGRLEEAEQRLTPLLDSDNTRADFHQMQAAIMIEQKRWNEAEQVLQRVLYLDPDNLEAIFHRGQIYKNLGKKEKLNREMNYILKNLKIHADDEPVSGMDGMTAGALRQMAMNYIKES